MSTGPLPENLPQELEALKLRLISMAGTDLAPEETQVLAAEISEIRLQLKRLAAEQAVGRSKLSQRRIDD